MLKGEYVTIRESAYRKQNTKEKTFLDAVHTMSHLTSLLILHLLNTYSENNLKDSCYVLMKMKIVKLNYSILKKMDQISMPIDAICRARTCVYFNKVAPQISVRQGSGTGSLRQ
jgi:hypothetical protein